MDFTPTITSVIEMNTFSSFWYWAAVAVAWAGASHWLLGVPFDVLYMARRYKGQSINDLEQLIDINLRRISLMDGFAGMALAALTAFLLVTFGVLGFLYGIEVAQGIFVLAAPLSVVAGMNFRLAAQLRKKPLSGEALVAIS